MPDPIDYPVAVIEMIDGPVASTESETIVSYTATVSYLGEQHTTTFTGTTWGAPGDIVMQAGEIITEVVMPERFGVRFNADWVRSFYTVSTR